MSQTIFKKLQLGVVSLSTLALLAACGDTSTTPDPDETEQPAIEEPLDTADETIPDEDTTDDTAGTDDSATSESGSTDTSNGISNVAFSVTFEQAIQKFRDTFGENVNIDEIKLDDEGRVYEYSISGWDNENEYDLDIDAETGEIREQETDRENDTHDEMINIESVMTPQEAMDIAVQESNSDRVEGWSLEVDDGITIYEIDFEGADDDDIKINAETGDIVDH